MNILIIEDEISLAEALKEVLDESGFNTDIANDGAEGLEKLGKKEYDLILLDLLMPALGGYDVLEIVKQEHKKTKVIIISNLSKEEEIQKAINKGAADYIVKSDVSITEVVSRIKKVLASKS